MSKHRIFVLNIRMCVPCLWCVHFLIEAIFATNPSGKKIYFCTVATLQSVTRLIPSRVTCMLRFLMYFSPQPCSFMKGCEQYTQWISSCCYTKQKQAKQEVDKQSLFFFFSMCCMCNNGWINETVDVQDLSPVSILARQYTVEPHSCLCEQKRWK